LSNATIAGFTRDLVRVKGTRTPFETPTRRRGEAQLLRELLEIPVIFTLSQGRRDRAAAQLWIEGAVIARILRVSILRARP
jgi:hypothetical protein